MFTLICFYFQEKLKVSSHIVIIVSIHLWWLPYVHLKKSEYRIKQSLNTSDTYLYGSIITNILLDNATQTMVPVPVRVTLSAGTERVSRKQRNRRHLPRHGGLPGYLTRYF